ncbi:CHASE3 domain-containing protein [Methylobacterium brachythecii]|uniref:histidine kinase n=1 Tax=Methylobacterium brachythecii TaxID=1176177 RepID=A0A7W6F504_9HYPH|nr:CHASE3 domain-containing protein [Methylobacterium brachythecii]MBB3900920.1 signal transduction histidine kinase [Methylobacterium brachythecii]
MSARLRRSTAKALAPLVGGFALLAAIVLATAWLVVTQQQSDNELRRLLDVRGDIVSLFSGLQDAETGQRGYLLTGDVGYLAPYTTAIEALQSRFDRVRAGLAEEPDQAADLAAFGRTMKDKLAELGATVEMRKAGQVEASLQRVRTGLGNALMERARALADKLDARTRQHILDLRRSAAAMALVVEVAIAIAVGLIVALAAFVVSDARRRNTRLTNAYEALRESNGALVVANANRDRLEAQLRQAQKMEAMGQLTGGLAHDFNNMLAIVVGNLNMLKRQADRGEPATGRHFERYVEQGLEGANRAATLTHRLLAFARKQPLAPESIEPNRLVSGMSELLRRTLGETVQVETVQAGGLWRSRADPHQLESALLNLAINARDAMPSGGRLTIETANAHIDEGYASDNLGITPGQYVMIAVTDTGTGMTPDVAAKAFEPFFTTKEVGQGTGLGLSQVFGFVRQSDGYVKIYSELGTGTTVKIYLPRLAGPAEAVAPKAAGRAASVPEGRPNEIILVVEDEPAVRRLTVEVLRDLNYTVIHAEGGAAALRLLDAHPEIALLFTDVVMPEMNGRQLVDAARQRRPELKVLYTTGYTRNAIVHNGVIDADVKLIGKPFTLEGLAHKVREAIAA